MENKNLEFDNTLQKPRKNWWQRNWKWFVPTGCVSLLVIFAVVLFGIYSTVTSMIKESTLFIETFEKVTSNEYVVNQLGEPIDQDGILQGNISVSDNSGEADMHIPLKGSKSDGTIHVIAYKENGEWNIETLTITIKNTQETINLLNE